MSGTDNNTYIRIRPNGIVEEVQEVVTKQTTARDYMEKVKQLAPKDVSTPIIPSGTIRYFGKATDGRARRGPGEMVEYLTMFIPSQVRTIPWRNRSSSDEKDIKTFKVAFPHLLIRFQFISQIVQTMYLGVVKKRPEHLQEAVYHMLMPNLFEDGKVCIQLAGTAGDICKTCEDNIDLFFTGSPFNQDLAVFPKGVANFPDWQSKTESGSRFILDAEWPNYSTLKEFTEGAIVQRRPQPTS